MTWRSPVVGATALMAAGAWLVLLLSVDMSGAGTMEMAAAAWVGAWTLMVAAMMGPSALWFARAASRSQREAVLLGLPYLLVWVLVGVAAYGLARLVDQLAGHASGSLPIVAGAALMLTGAYQVTPLKTHCLSRCRTPVGVLLEVHGRWRLPRAGAVYALWCVACCAPLMAALVTAGLMGAWWVAGIAVFLVVERAGEGSAIPRLAGAGFVVLGVLVATVPGLAPETMAAGGMGM